MSDTAAAAAAAAATAAAAVAVAAAAAEKPPLQEQQQQQREFELESSEERRRHQQLAAFSIAHLLRPGSPPPPRSEQTVPASMMAPPHPHGPLVPGFFAAVSHPPQPQHPQPPPPSLATQFCFLPDEKRVLPVADSLLAAQSFGTALQQSTRSPSPKGTSVISSPSNEARVEEQDSGEFLRFAQLNLVIFATLNFPQTMI